MTLRFASLASGSRGNALLVEFRNTLLMVDCGLSVKAVTERLARLGRTPADVTALLVTHEHSDHVQGVGRFSRRFGTPVWLTAGTALAAGIQSLPTCRTFTWGRRLSIGDVSVTPFPVPHDAREPCQFVFTAAGRRLGLITDAGHVTTHILAQLSRCDSLALECNHDLDTLMAGSYPQPIKARVASDLGHLNNHQAAALLRQVQHRDLQWAMALHLSERNNSPARVRESLRGLLDGACQQLHLATQDEPSPWLEIV